MNNTAQRDDDDASANGKTDNVWETPYYSMSWTLSQRKKVAVLMTALAVVFGTPLLLMAVEVTHISGQVVLVLTVAFFAALAAASWLTFRSHEKKLYQ